jgi:hypothetical protein
MANVESTPPSARDARRNAVFRRIVLIVSLSALALAPMPCLAADYHLRLEYTLPEAHASADANGTPVAVVVEDKRDFVVSHDKVPAHLGHYRSLAGVPWDVDNENEIAVADQFRSDLEKELQDLGFRKGDAATGVTLAVTIVQFDFNTQVNGRLTFDLRVVAKAADGHVLASNQFEDSRVIKGSFLLGPIGAMKREVPVIYSEIIRKIVREDPVMLAALRGQASPPASSP